MIYVDEEFYKNKYLLGKKPVISTGFDFYARSASQIIDQYTFDRLNELTDIPEEVRMCCCEVAEAEFRREKRREEAGGKTSEKIGTYSVSFGSVKEAAEAVNREQRNIILRWLGGTGLCYQGV